MDSILHEIIKKHAEKQGITEKEAIEIYNDYNREVNLKVDGVLSNEIAEVRIPHVMRFVFNPKKYENYTKANERKAAKEQARESELEGRLDVLDNSTL